MAQPVYSAKWPARQDKTGGPPRRLTRCALIAGACLLVLSSPGLASDAATRGLPAQVDPAEIRILIGTLAMILALALAQIVTRRRGPDRATARSTRQLR
ncbi:hypothetical protein [Pseudooceanicola sp.]|uniref:hypothetical protein n=1 Tax=Pseudooceanicola sp. TaxID=1914328 RepID=UPI0035C724B3